MPHRSVAVLAAAAVLVLGAACAKATTTGSEQNPAGDIPDNTAFVPFRPPAGGFEVKVPEGWARTDSGSVVLFTDKLNTVRVESVAAASAPTVDSARGTELPAVTASAANARPGEVTAVHRNAGDAVLITYQADSPADPVTGKVVRDSVERYEFFHGGTEVIVTLSGPVGADNVDPWRTVTDSLRWLA